MKEKLKIIKIIHISLCIGLIMAYVFIGNVTTISFNIPTLNQNNIIYILIPIIAYISSNYVFKTQLKKVNRNLKPEANFTVYQTASIIRWAILEGAAFLILFLNKDFILFGILIVLYFVLIHPTENRITSDLS